MIQQKIVRFGLACALALPAGLFNVQPAAAVSAFDHIIVIMLENHSFGQIDGSPDAPFLNGLAATNTLALDYHGITHPSLPNYMALTGGDTFFVDNCSIGLGGCQTAQPNIADRVEASGRTWKAYMEDMPSACYIGSSYPYVENHNPFIHYTQIQTNAARCGRIVPYSQLTADLATLPNFVWITPNQCDNMHDACDPLKSEVAVSDQWLSVEIPRIRQSASCTAPKTCLLAVTFDEGDSGLAPPEDNHVYTLLIGAGGTNSSVAYDHYSLLRTIRDSGGLPFLTPNDRDALAMTDMVP